MCKGPADMMGRDAIGAAAHGDRNLRSKRLRLAAFLGVLIVQNAWSDGSLDQIALEQEGAVIGQVILEKANVFDLSNPDEDKWLYRLANRWHIVTKDHVIEDQLLFRSGDAFSTRLVEESERILRRNAYFFDADIKTVLHENGVVDVVVATKDVWTLGPDLSLSRSGGENRYKIGLEETNLFGNGQTVRISRSDNVDRSSLNFGFFDKNLGSSRVTTSLNVADNSDGEFQQLSVVRPFYALDARWTAGANGLHDDRREAIYFLGNEAADYQHERDYFSAFGGWSGGLRDGWVTRWTGGITYDANHFSEVADPTLPAAIPEDRKLVYGFVGIQVVEDHFEATRNRDQIGRTEDFFMGTQLAATLGWSDEALGADRDALIYSFSANRGFGSLEKTALLLRGSGNGRFESGDFVNALLRLHARYYHTQSDKRLFFATLNVTAGHDLDLDNLVTLGGDSGLRGYPLRYQTGESKVLASIEQRYFTDWYPFQLARVGGAVFVDTGRVWGSNPLGEAPRGWLTDVGFGLRFALTRSGSRKMVHLDVAFPLNGDDSIDDVQILLEAKHSF
jgi:hypothetical protein